MEGGLFLVDIFFSREIRNKYFQNVPLPEKLKIIIRIWIYDLKAYLFKHLHHDNMNCRELNASADVNGLTQMYILFIYLRGKQSCEIK